MVSPMRYSEVESHSEKQSRHLRVVDESPGTLAVFEVDIHHAVAEAEGELVVLLVQQRQHYVPGEIRADAEAALVTPAVGLAPLFDRGGLVRVFRFNNSTTSITPQRNGFFDPRPAFSRFNKE